MSSEYKYLSDGRKVVIVGQINNTETIVQEIFVTEAGDEIPSGERFVVKSLHDAPVESYAVRRERELKESLERIELSIKEANRTMRREKSRLKAVHEMVKQSEHLASVIDGESFEQLALFLSGAFNYVVGDCSYDELAAPQEMPDAVIQWYDRYSERDYEAVRLLSVWGKSDGELDYRLHTYSDGSGSARSFFFFETYEEAIAHIKALATGRIEGKGLSAKSYAVCQELGITFTKKLQAQYRRALKATLKHRLKYRQDELAKRQAEVDETEAAIAEIGR